MTLITGLIILASLYGLVTLLLTYLVQQYPRKPVHDPPDWGRPDGPSSGTVLFMHGWGRNRDRMVARARLFAGWGFTAVIHSARDHGHSSPSPMMNIMKFAQDIETVLNWLDEPVILYGHSAGAAGACAEQRFQ